MDSAASLKDMLTVGSVLHPCRCSFDSSTRGSFTCDHDALWSAFMLRRCSMTTEDGRRFDIIVTTFTPERTAVRFKLL